MIDRERLIEDVYFITDEWESCPIRMPPFMMFSDCGVDTYHVALLLYCLRQRGYVFEVTAVPECVNDVMDLVEGKPFSRLVRDNSDKAYNFRPRVRQKRSWWQKIVDYFI